MCRDETSAAILQAQRLLQSGVPSEAEANEAVTDRRSKAQGHEAVANGHLSQL